MYKKATPQAVGWSIPTLRLPSISAMSAPKISARISFLAKPMTMRLSPCRKSALSNRRSCSLTKGAKSFHRAIGPEMTFGKKVRYSAVSSRLPGFASPREMSTK